MQEHIVNDVLNPKYDYIHLGTPCNTYSALREIPPGPRPLRTSDEIMGISEGLTQKEKGDLKEGNLHTEFSGKVMDSAVASYTPWSLENPEPQNDVTIFKTPVMAPWLNSINAVTAAKLPSLRGFSHFLLDISAIDEVRCNHPKREWVRNTLRAMNELQGGRES